MSTLLFRVYIFSILVAVAIIGTIAYIVCVVALVSFLLGVIDMLLLGWYVDPIYIVIGALVFVFLFLARIDHRFKSIEKLLKGVNDASQVTAKNSGHLINIDYNTVPELVAEHQSTGLYAIPIGRRDLPPMDATEPIPTISRLAVGAGVFYEQSQPASFCTNCGTPTRQTTGSLRLAGDR